MKTNDDRDDIVHRPGRNEVEGGLRLADDLLRVGDHARAAEAYARVADLFAGRGDVMQAVAVCYRALQVEPAHFASVVGDAMLRRLGPASRPLLERALEGYEASENYDAAAKVVRRLIDQDPDSPRLRFRLADLLEAGGKSDEAVELLWSAARILERDGNNALLLQFGARLLELAPDHRAARRTLAKAYLRVGDLADCLETVRPLVKAEHDPIGLEVLARVQVEIGRNASALEALRRLAAVRAAAGEHDLADRVLARAARWAVDDDYRNSVASLRHRLASGADLGPVEVGDDGAVDGEIVELEIELDTVG